MADMEVLAPGGHQHLVDKIKEQLAMKADASLASAVEKVIENQPTAVLSGTVLTAADAYAEPPVALTVDGKSTQDGTPTPESPVEIVSLEQPRLWFAGKNLFNLQDYTYVSGYFAYEGDVIHTDGTRRVVYMPCVPNTTYVASRSAVQTSERFYIGYTTENPAVGVTVYGVHGAPTGAAVGQKISVATTTGANAKYLVVWAYWASNIQALDTLQIEVGSTATAYQPYVGTSVLLNLTQALRSLPDGTKDTLALTYLRPSTREGWAWYTPTLTALVGDIDMGELTWTRYTNKTNPYFRATLPDSHTYSSNDGMPANKTRIEIGYTWASGTGCFNYATVDQKYNVGTWELGTRNHYLIVVDKQYETAEAFKAAMAGMEFMYELQAPVTTQLDPIELPILPAPECTVWSDPATGLQMRYVRDMQIVIDSLNSEIERAYAAIAPVESTTAKSNHAVGDYLMLGGTLCKVTSAIASGEAIAIGTNVAATTVDTELASLE